MLDELEVLALELLAGGLEAVDLGKLVLLLLERLTNDVARLGVGLVADAFGVLLRLGHDLIGRLLSGDERGRDLALGGGVIGLRSGRRRRSGRGLRSKLSLGVGELVLGRGQAVLKVDDLGEHRVDLGGKLLEEDVDLGGIVPALGLGEGLRLDVLGCDSHAKTPFSSRPHGLADAQASSRPVYLLPVAPRRSTQELQ